jgi:hypothetical protein
VIAAAHHQAPAILIPVLREPGNIGINLGLQCLGQHPPGTFADDLIDQRRRTILPALAG